MTGGRSEIEFIPYETAYAEGFDDMRRRVPDLTKVRQAIGYEPRRNLDTILRDLIEFEKARTATG